MDLESLAAWGEFIGGVGGVVAALAVVASLVFVGIQLRASLRQSNADSYSTVTSLWAEFTSAVAASDESWEIFYGGMRDYASLSRKDKARFNFLIGMYFGIQDTILVHHSLGVWRNNETYQRALEESWRVFSTPGVQAWWQEHRGRVFAPGIEAYLTERAAREQQG